jgi:hypothetical protein
MRLPSDPSAAYWLIEIKGRALGEISFLDYNRALDKIPATSVQEVREAETDAMLASILHCRRAQLDKLRARWIQTGYRPSR